MEKETTFRKTDAGAAAIASRHPALVPRERALLILVDGKRTVAELVKLGGGTGDVQRVLQSLQAQGFIESTAQLPPAVGATGGPPEAASLAAARRLAVRRLNDLLGPSATDLCLRLEATHTVQEFRAAVRRVEAVLRDTVGPQRAAQFMSELDTLRA